MNLDQMLIGVSLLENIPLTMLVVLIVFIVGLFAGQLIVCMGWRIGHGQDRLVGHAHCDHCGHELRLVEQIPLVSWIALKGRCRYCGRPIGRREPLGELLVALVYVSITLRYGLDAETLELILLASALIVCGIASLYNYTVPNGAIAFAVIVRAAYVASLIWYKGSQGDVEVASIITDSLIGAAIMGGMGALVAWICGRLTRRETPCAGDIKLMAVAGLYLGWQHAFILLVIAGCLALLVALVWPRGHFDVEDYDPADFDYAPEEFTDGDQQLAEELATISAGETAILSADEIQRALAQDRPRQQQEIPAGEDPLAGRSHSFGPGTLDFGSSLSMIPFCPSMVMAFWIMMLAGAPTLGWYMAIF